MRVLITGATGFVGGHLVRLLASRRTTIYGTYLADPKTPDLAAELFRCDLRDCEQLRAVVKETRPDRVFHLAAISKPMESQESFKDVYDTNFWGTYHLLESVRQFSSRARVLIVGSAQSYGELKSSKAAIAEDQQFAPPNPYALSKASADMLAGQYYSRFGMHVVRARPFNHTGPCQKRGFVCSDYAFQCAEIELGLRKPLLSIRNPDVERDFSDVRDVVRAYDLLLQKGKPGEAYNIASGRLISIREIVAALTSQCSQPVRISEQNHGLRLGDISRLRANNRKVRRETGWKPSYNMRQTLRDLFECWRNNLHST